MTRLRREDGHTLPELLTALGMATVILLATFALLDHVMKRTAETQARVEATQRGRQAMDTMSRALRSSVCLSGTVPAVSQADASTTDVLHGPRRRRGPAAEAGPRLRPCEADDRAADLPGHGRAAGDGLSRVARPGEAPGRERAPGREHADLPLLRLRPRSRRRRRRSRCRVRSPPPTSAASRGSRSPSSRTPAPAPWSTSPRSRSATTCTSAPPIPTTQLPIRHAHEPLHTHPWPRRRRGRLLHAGGHDRHDLHVDVRRRRLRRGERRPADQPQLAGPQVDLRRGRGRAELLPVPPQRGQRLLDRSAPPSRSRTRRRTARSTRCGTASGPIRASGATSRARTRSTRSSCCRRPATRRASQARRRA